MWKQRKIKKKKMLHHQQLQERIFDKTKRLLHLEMELLRRENYLLRIEEKEGWQSIAEKVHY